jgi:hypothetical protein
MHVTPAPRRPSDLRSTTRRTSRHTAASPPSTGACGFDKACHGLRLAAFARIVTPRDSCGSRRGGAVFGGPPTLRPLAAGKGVTVPKQRDALLMLVGLGKVHNPICDSGAHVRLIDFDAEWTIVTGPRYRGRRLNLPWGDNTQ